jgi:alkylation response protein AidB-like acyl-CoA dehydrogenase
LAGANAADRAKAIIPQLSALSEDNEKAQRLTPQTLALLADAGLMYYLVPKCFGGEEVWPVEMMEIIEHMSHADPSTGWSMMALNLGTAAAAAYLPASAAKQLFSTRIPLLCGQAGAVGRATPEPGGYRLSGNWAYGSGIYHAEYAYSGALVQDGDDVRRNPVTGLPENRLFVVPIEQVTLKGNWDVLGLRATGSIDYAVTDAFVAEDFQHDITADEPNHGGDLFRLGTMALAILMHGAFATGVARRALEEITLFAMSGRRTANFPQLGGGETFQEDYGRAVASYQAARSGMLRYAETCESYVARGCPLPTRELTLGVLAAGHANQTALEIARLGYYYQGGTALRQGTMQRIMRDITASNTHYLVSRNLQRHAAKEVMGLFEGKTWSLMGFS